MTTPLKETTAPAPAPSPESPSPIGCTSAGGEYYQSLVNRLQCMANGRPAPKVVGVTSGTRGEGVSTVAAELAVHSARSLARPVLLIDTANSLASTGRSFGRQEAPGLTDVLAGETELSDCIQESPVDHLFVLGMGTSDVSAGASFAPAKVAEVLQSLQAEFEFIVVDLPAVSDVSVCLSLACSLDGVLLVVEAERVRSHLVERAKRQLDEAGARLLGVVLNKCRCRTSE